MTSTKINYPVFLFLLVSALCLWSCSKDSEKQATNSGKVMIHLHTNIGFDEVGAYNTIYTSREGRKISLTIAQLYISNIQLVKENDSVYSVPDVVLLKTMETEEYYLDNIPFGNYKSIRFYVGLNPAENAKVPSGAADSIFNKPAMWFGSTPQPQGYVFLNFQGKMDTTARGTGSEDQMKPFSYRIGTNANYTQVAMPDETFTVASGTIGYVHLIIDYMELFSDVVVNNNSNLSVNSPADNASDIAVKIRNNIPRMFRYE